VTLRLTFVGAGAAPGAELPDGASYAIGGAGAGGDGAPGGAGGASEEEGGTGGGLLLRVRDLPLSPGLALEARAWLASRAGTHMLAVAVVLLVASLCATYVDRTGEAPQAFAVSRR
jgi:hypothetical protein